MWQRTPFATWATLFDPLHRSFFCEVGGVDNQIAHAVSKGGETFVVGLTAFPAYINLLRELHTYKRLVVRKHAGEDGLRICIEE